MPQYEIVRFISNFVFPDGFEEPHAEPKEFPSFADALEQSKESVMFDDPEFTLIDNENERAEFIVKKRMRYAGTIFILRRAEKAPM